MHLDGKGLYLEQGRRRIKLSVGTPNFKSKKSAFFQKQVSRVGKHRAFLDRLKIRFAACLVRV